MMKIYAMSAAGASLLCMSIVMFAPDAFPQLWALKSGSFFFGSLALLFTSPDDVLAAIKARLAGTTK